MNNTSHIGTYRIINNENLKIKEDSVVLTLYSNESNIGIIENEIEISGDLLRDIISKFGSDRKRFKSVSD